MTKDIYVFVFSGTSRDWLRLSPHRNQGLPIWRIPTAEVKANEKPSEVASRYAKKELELDIAPEKFLYYCSFTGDDIYIARVDAPFDDQFRLALTEEATKGWMRIEDRLADAWCNPQHWDARLIPLLYETRPVQQAMRS